MKQRTKAVDVVKAARAVVKNPADAALLETLRQAVKDYDTAK